MVKSYDLKRVICTVASVPISGYGDSDAITVEWASDLWESMVGADGEVVYSRLNDRRMNVTITLHQKSLAHLLLAGILAVQSGDSIGLTPPLLVPIPFFLQDLSTGETISSFACVLVSRPAPSKGKTIGTVAYKLELPSPMYTPAVLNVV